MRKSIFLAIAFVPLAACQTPEAGGARVGVRAINRMQVDSDQWWLEWADAGIVGGRDGCNDWRYQAPGSPIVVSNAQECPADAKRGAYWRIVSANRSVALRTIADRQLKVGSETLTLNAN